MVNITTDNRSKCSPWVVFTILYKHEQLSISYLQIMLIYKSIICNQSQQETWFTQKYRMNKVWHVKKDTVGFIKKNWTNLKNSIRLGTCINHLQLKARIQYKVANSELKTYIKIQVLFTLKVSSKSECLKTKPRTVLIPEHRFHQFMTMS